MQNSEQRLPIISQQQLMKELDCSRYFLESLMKENKLRKVYLRDKPYFYIEDVLALLTNTRLSA